MANDSGSIPMAPSRDDGLDKLPYYYFTDASGEENWYEKEIGIEGRNKILAQQKKRQKKVKRSTASKKKRYKKRKNQKIKQIKKKRIKKKKLN